MILITLIFKMNNITGNLAFLFDMSFYVYLFYTQ